MTILTLETATDACSAAILRDGQVREVQGRPLHRLQRAGSEHAKQLPLMVEELLTELKKLDEIGANQHPLDAIVVSAGPGSYTGLRIGASIAKGLAYGMNLPLYAIPTLQTMATQVATSLNPSQHPSALLCPMLDARRMEVYTALYDSNLRELQPATALIVDEHAFQDELASHQLCFFGNGADKCKPLITSENAVFIDNIVPDAEWVGKTFFQLLTLHSSLSTVDVAYWTPFYLKDYEAKKSTNKVLNNNQ